MSDSLGGVGRGDGAFTRRNAWMIDGNEEAGDLAPRGTKALSADAVLAVRLAHSPMRGRNRNTRPVAATWTMVWQGPTALEWGIPARGAAWLTAGYWVNRAPVTR